LIDLAQATDSRLKGYNGRVTHPHLAMERTYCAQCGCPKGFVSMESYEFIRFNNILVLCDQCQHDLQVKYGDLPLAECPIEEFRPDAIVGGRS
jgi:NAD-dependent SIR2 family protein deacetylase